MKNFGGMSRRNSAELLAGPVAQSAKLLEWIFAVGGRVVDRLQLPAAGVPANFQMLPGLLGHGLERFGVAVHPSLDAIELLEQAGMAGLEHGRRLPGVLFELLDRLLLAGREFVEHPLAGLRQFGLDQIVLRLIFVRRPGERLVVFVLRGVQFRLEPSWQSAPCWSANSFSAASLRAMKFLLDPLLGRLALGRKPM